jgi:hypothetical protein
MNMLTKTWAWHPIAMLADFVGMRSGRRLMNMPTKTWAWRPIAMLAVVLLSRTALAAGADQPAAASAGASGAAGQAGSGTTLPGHAGAARLSAPAWLPRDTNPARPPGFEASWPGLACAALILAACGGIAAWARRFAPRAGSGAVQLVGRLSLSPRHTVYLLRAGNRVLLVGAGPGGPPALISELDELPEQSQAHRQEGES